MKPEAHAKCLRAIAYLTEQIRIDSGATAWNYHGILNVLERIEGKSIDEIAKAALWFARHRTKQDTPLMLAEDGAHWHLDDDEQRGPYLPKPKCLTEPMGDPLPVERIREIRMKAQASSVENEGNPA